MKLNEKFTVTIEDLTHEGEGVAKVDGFPLFIPNALPGDEMVVMVTRVRKNFGLASKQQLINPSPNRVNPLCELFNQCGGCQTMSLNYPTQLIFKEKRVSDSLKRIGKIDTVVKPVLGMKEPWHYRNKAQFPIGLSHHKLSIGFYRQGSHDIIDTRKCHIQHSIMENVVKILRDFLEKEHISIYNETTNTGLVRHLVTKVGFATGEVMVILVINGKHLPKSHLLVEALQQVNGLVSVVLNENTKRTNVIMGKENQVIFGKAYLTDRLHHLDFQISPHAFFQVNPAQTEVLYDKVLEMASLTGSETVMDLYCGIGTISLFLAQKARKVIGIESVEPAVEDARANAHLNHISNVEFMAGPAENWMPQLAQSGIQPEVIVVDPPRKGCDEVVLLAMIQMNPDRIVYVSCNPATLARDLRILEDGGYQTLEVQPVDLFPHTSHVETVVLMSRAEK
ncbi:23S rRNA (uracil(1939)-C(5))-methyltransferase RlmD [Anoxynatronum sibiricum]|uniref:23S rRNA (Uracil(1939)-C(5))-methyltransferase RlmD n=1 Tax=Anoxynatronum sibiricum TaxID=210623 RepID=A0ABU9VRW0_9CLOT